MISVVICSVTAAKFDAVSQMYHRALGTCAHEIIGIHDAQSLCEGYNRALGRCSGEQVIFSHDDLEILTPDFPARLQEHLSKFDMIGIAGANRCVSMLWAHAGPPHIYGQAARPGPNGTFDVEIFSVPNRAIGGMQVLDGVFIAAHRSVVQAIGFDAANFDGFHGYDSDFTFRAHLAGYKLAVCPDIAVLHFGLGKLDERWRHYAQVFQRKFETKLAPRPDYRYSICTARVPRKEDILRVMTPAHW
ncbi:MAG: glycosyltransferase [Tepidisphaeraceae bacterium]